MKTLGARIVSVVVLLGAVAGRLAFARPAKKVAPPPPKQIHIDLDNAVPVAMPASTPNLTPVALNTPDGRTGWVVRIPGDRPIATPAYADGKLFVGGGYGSYEFYAFDAETGKKVWQMKTSDDGPTAAVVEDGCVAFNTESCTVIVADAQTGKLMWQEWLGDPLMSQPAISKGRLYMSYPAGQSGHHGAAHQNGAPNNAAVQQAAKPIRQAPGPNAEKQPAGWTHRMLCADLRTGRHHWSVPIPAEVISAPVVEGDRLLLTCFDGTSLSLDASTGKTVWLKKNAGTSAPIVAGGQVVMTQKESRGGASFEGIKRIDANGGLEKDKRLLASGKAEYLAAGKGGGVGIGKEGQAKLDASVGFSSAPAAANLAQANKSVGVNTVVGGWAYQGSRAVCARGQIMNAQGRSLNALSSTTGALRWQAKVKGGGAGDQVFAPPALGRENLYLSSLQGHLASVRQKDGKVGFLYALKQPITFQPALARGNLYVGTSNGLFICLRTGQKEADGWTAWGGNAQHNKRD